MGKVWPFQLRGRGEKTAIVSGGSVKELVRVAHFVGCLAHFVIWDVTRGVLNRVVERRQQRNQRRKPINRNCNELRNATSDLPSGMMQMIFLVTMMIRE